MRFQGDDGHEHPGQEWLWEEALRRAMNGKRGQQVLRDLETALLALPEKKLIEGGLSDGSNVCAVGAYVVQKRVDGGEDRQEVLDKLKAACWSEHWDKFEGFESEMATIDYARAAGMQLTIACTIAGQNDDYYALSDEERYERILAWVHRRIIPEEVAA